MIKSLSNHLKFRSNFSSRVLKDIVTVLDSEKDNFDHYNSEVVRKVSLDRNSGKSTNSLSTKDQKCDIERNVNI